MTYPSNFETKIGFHEIRQQLKSHCLSTLGKDRVDKMEMLINAGDIRRMHSETREFRRIEEETDSFPTDSYIDMREVLNRVRLEGTHLEVEELHDLRRSLNTICQVVAVLSAKGDDDEYSYPTLQRQADGVSTFPGLVHQAGLVIDEHGEIRDTASKELQRIREELRHAEGNVTRVLQRIMQAARRDGIVDKDTTPTMRDGRLMIPLAPGMKRKINGIVHDESATGRTVFVEPSEVIEANNRIRELENDERQEIIRILTEITKLFRPYTNAILDSYRFLGEIDMIRARKHFADNICGIEPELHDDAHIDWIQAIHPLLRKSLARQDKKIVPLDITLSQDKRILLISGPNAGGKSVCLKTVGLLQYMLQCGLSVPMSERSTCGVFQTIMIDIGDEQSIEDDLSTYSSHLLNMKNMIRQSGNGTMLLIDEFGGGTEPQIGGAIAESVLKQFCKRGSWGVITTHYQNLKHFADENEGVVNGAMLYDRHEMRPLFQLEIGRPGSSFAIEIARKTGLPEEVINDASEIVGNDYIQSDKYLQDIVRDKRYWANKRQNIHQREKDIEKTINRYETSLTDVERSRKEIITKAKEQAEELLREANRRIENTIREIRESQAEKEDTRRIREELREFEREVKDINSGIMSDAEFEKKLRQMEARKERKEKRRKEKKEKEQNEADRKPTVSRSRDDGDVAFAPGDTVKMRGLQSIGKIESINGKMAMAVFGGMRTKVALDRLEHAKAGSDKTEAEKKYADFFVNQNSQMTRNTIDSHRSQFRQEIDLRGMRADEALSQVQYFIDDTILMGVGQVRILHGKGNGILRQLIRQYLSSVPNVKSFRDEQVQFGGAGITVVEME